MLNRDYRKKNPDAVKAPAPFKALVADAFVEFVLATIYPAGNPTNGITRTQTQVAHSGRTCHEVHRPRRPRCVGNDTLSEYVGLPRLIDGPRKLLGYASFPAGCLQLTVLRLFTTPSVRKERLVPRLIWVDRDP